MNPALVQAPEAYPVSKAECAAHPDLGFWQGLPCGVSASMLLVLAAEVTREDAYSKEQHLDGNGHSKMGCRRCWLL